DPTPGLILVPSGSPEELEPLHDEAGQRLSVGAERQAGDAAVVDHGARAVTREGEPAVPHLDRVVEPVGASGEVDRRAGPGRVHGRLDGRAVIGDAIATGAEGANVEGDRSGRRL